MNRHRICWIGAVWLMLVLLIGCMPTTSEVEPGTDLTPEAGTAEGDVTATAVSTPIATPTIEEPEMNDKANTPQPENPSLQNPPQPQDDPAASKPLIPVPDSPRIQEQVGKAKDDLAQQLSIDAAEIGLVEYQAVTWRDGSLGCPRPGMAYTQALVEGYRIQLQVKSTQYDYHGAAGRDPFYCPKPAGKFDAEGTLPAPGLNES